VPRIDVATRLNMLERVQSISRELNQKAGSQEPITEKENSKLAAAVARRQGLLAVATLDPRCFDDESSGSGHATTVRDLVKRFAADEEGTSAGLLRAGEEVGLHWRRLAAAVRKRAEDARRAGPEKAAENLLAAERLARQMDGASASLVPGNPVQEARKVRVHDLLLWLARRTYQDHWYDENNQPYYRAAAELYLNGARDLIAGGSDLTAQQKQDRQKKVAQTRKYVEQPAEQKAELVRPRRTDFTGESEIRLQFALDRGAVPAGYPVAWLTASPGLRYAAGRQVLDLKKEATKQLTFALEPPAVADPNKRVERLESTLEVRFRGKRQPVATKVNVYLRPDVVWSKPEPPPEAGIAVRASKEIHDRFAPRNGAIAIVLDCSGSMSPWYEASQRPNRQDYINYQQMEYSRFLGKNKRCKYHEATKALGEVLQDLPAGVQVSVIVFSHAVVDADGVPDGRFEPRTPEDTIEIIREPQAWNPNQGPALIKRLERLVPFNETPLVRAIRKAHKYGFPEGHKGFKTLLVLTDGEDNRFDGDTALKNLHPGTKSIAEWITAEFKASPVRLNMIGFRVAQGEQEGLTKQFKEALENLPRSGGLRGAFYAMDEVDKLKAALARGLKQKLSFTLERDRTPANEEDDGHTVSLGLPDDDDDWAMVPPGDNRVRVELDRPLEQRIHVEPGDFLLIKVRDDGKGFERLVYGDDWEKLRLRRDQDGWALSLLQNQLSRTEKQRLDLTLAVESRRDRERDEHGILRQIKPRQVWFDVKPAGDEKFDGTLRWTDLRGYPGRTLGLELTNWPPRAGGADPAAAKVTAYWNGDEDPRRAVEMPLPGMGGNFRAFEGEEAVLGGDPTDKVVIESVEIKRYRVEVEPGRRREENCLIVRVSHPRGKPVWLLPDSRLDVVGQEHRFYHEADKYTGIFWGNVTVAGANALLKRFYVYSVQAFKGAPGTLNCPLEPNPPSDREFRPSSVLQLRRKANQ
jgi:hypothetical protein